MTHKTCSKCKETKSVAEFSKSARRPSGYQLCCKACNVEYRKANADRLRARNAEYRKANADRLRAQEAEYVRTEPGRFYKAKRSAKKRGLEFTLTFEQYIDLIAKDCAYCDGFFGKVVAGVGLDRLDNSLGYEPGNVVSCCANCNYIRRDILTPEETRAAVQAVIALRKQQEAG